MRSPPPLPGRTLSPVESSLDRALALSLSGELENALRLATAIVRHDPANAAALCIAGRVLGELGRLDDARASLNCAVDRAIDLADAPLAVAAAHELARFGGDEGPALERVGTAFGKGSHPAALLPLPADDVFEPIPRATVGDELLDVAATAVRDAIAADHRAGTAGPPRASTPPPFATDASRIFFGSITGSSLAALWRACTVLWLSEGKLVLEQDAVGDEAYFVARGEVAVWRERGENDVALARLGAGAIFGEMALLARVPRTASVAASRPTIALEVKREALDALADLHPEVGHAIAKECRARMRSTLSRTSPVLQVVPHSDRAALMARFEARTFQPKQPLTLQNDLTPGLYLIASGEVAVVRHEPGDDEPLVVARLGPGDVVGEVAMVLRRPANADVIAIQPTVTLFLPAAEFVGMVRAHPSMLAELYLLAIRRDEELSTISEEEAVPVEDFLLV